MVHFNNPALWWWVLWPCFQIYSEIWTIYCFFSPVEMSGFFFFFFFFFFLNKWFKLIKLNLANPGKCDLPDRPFRSCYIVARYWCSDLIDQNNGRSEKSCYPFLIFRIHNFDHADNKNMIDLNSGNSKIIYAYGLALLFLHH